MIILLIEDNKLVMNLVKDVLKQGGWSVKGYEDGLSALRELEGSERYDIIITDNDLPGICGLELIGRARKMSHRRCTPIIMLSANCSEAQAIEAGADAFLRKPEDVLTIPGTVARLLAAMSSNGLRSGTVSRPDAGS